MDAFASEANARCPRYWSRFGEPGCEAVDALSVPDWGYSTCPCCGRRHREVAFPPMPLTRRAVLNAVLLMLVVPVAVLAPQ